MVEKYKKQSGVSPACLFFSFSRRMVEKYKKQSGVSPACLFFFLQQENG